MADRELDLEKGDPDAEAEAAVNKARRGKAVGSTKSSTSRPGAGQRVEMEIRSRLDRVFGKLADMLDARDDSELADAIRDEKDPMAQAFVSATSNFKWLRSPVIFALNMLEIGLAFHRVGSILVGRLLARRERVMAEREAMATEMEPSEPVAA